MSDGRPERPEPLDVDPDAVPESLVDRDHWLVWKYEWQADRDEWAKIPKNGSGGDYRIDATDPDNGVAFDVAVETYENGGYDGLGLITDPGDLLVGFDFDDCRDPERAADPVPDVVSGAIDTLDSYTEVSPSGTGYRAFAFGVRPGDRTRRDLPCDPVLEDVPHLEIYDGTGGRYLTVTGRHVSETSGAVETRPEEIKDIYAEYIADDVDDSDQDAGGDVNTQTTGSNPGQNTSGSRKTDLTDAELIEKAKNADNGDKFERLWNGRTTGYESHSEADLALCGLLAFYSGGDRRQIDRLFRQSGLCRDKWDADRGNKTYGEETIEKTLEGRTDFYDPSTPAKRSDAVDDRDDRDDLPTPSAFDVVDGGYAIWHKPRDDDADGWHEQVTNFELEVVSRLTHDDGQREYRLRVHPADAGPYIVDVEPAVFNELRKFRREVLEGWSVTFDGGQSELNDLKQFVARQDAPTREGTKQIGLHGDEFVTPEGSLTADGWTDEPAVVYTDESSQLRPLWQLSPDDDPDDVDHEAIAEILRELPQTRDAERFLPVLGWFYAAPLRPLIQQWDGEFNLLNVLGDTGAGKTATLETLWQLFGMDGELLTAETTPFTMLTALSSTNGLPVVFDEYKPADMSERRKDKLHRYLRTSTKGGIESKGNADRTTDNYHLNAPVCLSGEQPIQGPAEERRTIMTTFTRDGVIGDTPQSRAFARIAGGKAGDEFHDGLPLEDHALAFYTWILDQDAADLRTLWRESRESAVDVLNRRDLDADVLDDMVVQGFQTIRFGCTLFRAFADEFDVDPDTTGVTADAIADAIAYVAGEGGGADHVSHLDRFVGLLGRAAAAGYIEPGEHYTTVDTGVNDTRELRVKLSTAFDKVRRYAREHDVRGEDLLDSVNDYRARIRDNAENSTGYVTTTSQPTPLDGSLTRCVGIDVELADTTIDNFEVGMFTGEDDVDQDDHGEGADEFFGGTVDLAGLSPGRREFDATVAAVLDSKPWHQGEGTLRDESGQIDYVVRGGNASAPELEAGRRYHFEDARVTTDSDGVLVVEIRPGSTRIAPLNDPTSPTSVDDHDGAGEGAADLSPPSGKFDGTAATVVDTIQQNGGEVSMANLALELSNGDTTPDDVESVVDRLSEKGRVITRGRDGGTMVELNT